MHRTVKDIVIHLVQEVQENLQSILFYKPQDKAETEHILEIVADGVCADIIKGLN